MLLVSKFFMLHTKLSLVVPILPLIVVILTLICLKSVGMFLTDFNRSDISDLNSFILLLKLFILLTKLATMGTKLATMGNLGNPLVNNSFTFFSVFSISIINLVIVSGIFSIVWIYL